MKVTLYRDVHLKGGTTLRKGERVDAVPSGYDTYARVTSPLVAGHVLLRWSSIRKQPGVGALERWDNDGVCKTVSGKTVEPDGHDCDGYPSWLLALGMI